MKSGIHPEYHPVVFVDSSTGEELVTMSTASSQVTREIDGVEHYEIRIRDLFFQSSFLDRPAEAG